MFNKILIALSIIMLSQLGSATVMTPDQVATAFTSSGLIVDSDNTDSGGYKVLVMDLVQGTDLSPNQAFAIAAISIAHFMVLDDNHYAVSIIGVATTDGKIHYFEMTQEQAEKTVSVMQSDDNGAAGGALAYVIMFNNLPTLG
jgi:hypothetical protein